jgi:hypothetical protein
MMMIRLLRLEAEECSEGVEGKIGLRAGAGMWALGSVEGQQVSPKPKTTKHSPGTSTRPKNTIYKITED